MKMHDLEGVLDHFPGATKRTRPAESIFAIRFERKLLFLGQILIQSIGFIQFLEGPGAYPEKMGGICKETKGEENSILERDARELASTGRLTSLLEHSSTYLGKRRYLTGSVKVPCS